MSNSRDLSILPIHQQMSAKARGHFIKIPQGGIMIKSDGQLLMVAIGVAIVLIIALGLFSWKVIPHIGQPDQRAKVTLQ